MNRNNKGSFRRFLLDGRSLRLPYVADCAVLDARTAFPLNFHAHAGYEICCLLSGETHWVLANGGILHLPADSFSVIQPDVEHEGRFQRIDPCELVWLVFDPGTAAGVKGTFPLGENLLLNMARVFGNAGNVVQKGDTRMRTTAQTLADTVRQLPGDNIPPDSLAWLQTLLTQVVLAVYDLLRSQRPSAPRLGADMVARCDRFIQDHMEEPMGVPDMARHVGMHTSAFFARFKQQTGMTPADYLRRTRINKAQELMMRTNKSITEIALECGFSSSQYFASIFKEYTGVQPSGFRRKFRGA